MQVPYNLASSTILLGHSPMNSILYSNGRKALDMQILIDFASSSFGKKGFLEPIWRVASDMQS